MSDGKAVKRVGNTGNNLMDPIFVEDKDKHLKKICENIEISWPEVAT
jgi:hypothetical protein